MKLIRSNCRVQFTAEDMDFILEVMRPGVDSKQCLEQLLTDEDTRDLILDDEKLLHAILEHRGCLKISTHFYFYILVRQVFRKSHLDERCIADYVAALLTEFSDAEQSQLRVGGAPVSMDYVCDMLGALQTVDDTTRFYIRAHIGNYSLFVSGIFPDRIRHRREVRGAPDLSYYEEMGRTNYRVASDHCLARHYELTGIYHTLADRFQDTRLALNEIGDRLLTLADKECPRQLLRLLDS